MIGIIRQEIGILLLKNEFITLMIQITRQKIEGGMTGRCFGSQERMEEAIRLSSLREAEKIYFGIISFTGDEAICPFYYGFRFTGCHTQQ